MHRLLSILLVTLVGFAFVSPSQAQPLCLPVDSLDLLVVGNYDIVRGRVTEIDSDRQQAKIRVLTIEILDALRGDQTGQVRIPYDTYSLSSTEASWPDRLLESQGDILLFLSSTPWSYPHGTVRPELEAFANDHSTEWFYRAHVLLDGSGEVYSADFSRLTEPDEIVRQTNQRIVEADTQPTTKTIELTFPNNNFLIVPLSDRLEEISTGWKQHSDSRFRSYATQIEWEFKLFRNQPFDAGYWSARIGLGDGNARFGLRIVSQDSREPFAYVINGEDAIRVDDVRLQGDELSISFPSHDSKIVASVDQTAQTMEGKWTWQSEAGDSLELPFAATFQSQLSDYPDTTNMNYDFLQAWQLEVSESEQGTTAEFDTSSFHYRRYADPQLPVIGKLRFSPNDYAYWGGTFVDGKLEVSQFDGRRASLVRAEMPSDHQLRGQRLTSDGTRESWTAEVRQVN